MRGALGAWLRECAKLRESGPRRGRDYGARRAEEAVQPAHWQSWWRVPRPIRWRSRCGGPRRRLSTSTRQTCRSRAMYSGNRSGGQGFWEGGGAAGAEGPGPVGTQSPAPLFTRSTYERLALLLGSVALLGVGNNLLVLVLYYKFQRLRTPTHLFLVNISLSDLLVSVFGVAFNFVSCLSNGWVWDSAGCLWDGFSSSLFEKFQSQMHL